MFPMTHLSLKIFPNGVAFDVIFIDSLIFNRNIVHGITNMIRWKDSITTTNSSKVDTKNLTQRIIGQCKGILRFIVNYHPPSNNNNMMITSMCSHYRYDQRKFHIPQNVDRFLQVFKAFDLEQTCGAELEFFTKNPQTFLN